jgi:sigma-B regulation protein RsbU (phosphoserine phosphatase)
LEDIKSETDEQVQPLVNGENSFHKYKDCIRLAFENANIGICLVDLEGRLLEVNRRMCDIFGYSKEDFEGMSVNDITHPHFLDVSPHYIRRASNGEVTDGEFLKKYIHKKGHIVWGQVSSSLVRDNDGTPQYFISYVKDITEIKRIEQELRMERDFNSAVLSTAGALVVVLDRRGRIVRFNRACEKLTGYLFTEVERKRFWDLFLLPTEMDQVKVVFENLKSGIFPNEHENYWLTKNGASRLIKWSNTVIVGTDGSVEYVIGTGIDITDTRAAEERLHDSEKKYRSLLANLDTAVVVHAPDTRILLSNYRAQELLGLSDANMTNRKDIDPEWYFVRDDGTRLPVKEYPVNIVITTLKPLQYYLVGINHPKNNHIVWVEVNAFPEFDDDGNLRQIVVTFWDVTKRKTAEDNLAKRTLDLVNINKELRRQITERKQVAEKLRNQQRQADKDLEVAATIQQTLIPRYSPRIGPIRFAWRFEPCEQIGGDIFNFQYTGKNGISFYMFDVCGHGVSSALIAAAVSQFIQTSCEPMVPAIGTPRPDSVLNNLERAFPFERFESFFTIVYLTVDYSNGSLSYSSAGHPPPILMGADGSLRLLKCHGPVIGTGSVHSFLMEEVSLRSGDKVIVYTDGILDYSNDRGEFFGKERLLDTLRKHAGSPVQTLMEMVQRSLKNFAGAASPEDDASIMTIEYMG